MKPLNYLATACAAGLIVLLYVPAFGQCSKNINQYDSQGRRQGKWISYWDDDKKVPMNIEHFKDGRERGRCRYFYLNGALRLQFKAQKDGRMKVKYVNEDGRVEKKGWAVMIYDPKEIRYSWNGPWKFYENGKLIRKAIYKMGEEIASHE